MPRARRRTFTNAAKRRILQATDLGTRPGEVGALMRREGVYSSSLSTWRRQREAADLAALAPQQRGPKVDPARIDARQIALLIRERDKPRARCRCGVSGRGPVARRACTPAGASAPPHAGGPAEAARTSALPAPGPGRPGAAERQTLLGTPNSERFADTSPVAAHATLLDEGTYIGSVRTMYRLLATTGGCRKRRNQLTHPTYTKPELLAVQPNQVWSWNITKLKGAAKWTCFHLYLILESKCQESLTRPAAAARSAPTPLPAARHSSAAHAARPVRRHPWTRAARRW